MRGANQPWLPFLGLGFLLLFRKSQTFPRQLAWFQTTLGGARDYDVAFSLREMIVIRALLIFLFLKSHKFKGLI